VGTLEPGTVLGDRYRLERPIGHGSTGTVYEAEHFPLGRRVAVKVMHPELVQRADVMTRFEREAKTASSLGHPNIIEIHDFAYLPSGVPFIVFEHLTGRDLATDFAREGPQRVDKMLRVLAHVCRGLGKAHAEGVVHRDIKPENLFLTNRAGDPFFVKLLDFGVSKVELLGTERLTRSGTVVGTPFYMSPEQCRAAKDIDHRSDIFSLGVVIYTAFTGHRPFQSDQYARLVRQIMTAAPPPIAHSRPDVPLLLSDLAQRMLAKDPSHRPQSCEEILSVLRTCGAP
jgi:serine/threonine protein kinase